MIKKISILVLMSTLLCFLYINITPGYYQPIPCGCGLKYQTYEQYKESEAATLEVDPITGVKGLKSGVLCASCYETFLQKVLLKVNKFDFNKN